MKNEVKLYVGESLGKYGFPDGHPFGTDRQAAFWKEAVKRGLDRRAAITDPRMAAQEELHRFHTPEHVAWVKEKSDEATVPSTMATRRHARVFMKRRRWWRARPCTASTPS